MFETIQDSRQPRQPGGACSRRRTEEERPRAQRRAQSQRDRYLLGQARGAFNHELLTVLHLAGFTAETVVLLEFVPMVHIAWADGAVSSRQRDLILQIATGELVGEETPAHDRLIGWLERCPPEGVFAASLFAIHVKLDSLPMETGATLQRKLVRDCTAVALAADSALGDHKISMNEGRVLAQFLASIKPRMFVNSATVRNA